MSFIIDGTNGATFPNGNNPQAAPSKVLQVVSMTNNTISSMTGSTATDTGLTLSITPLFSTSKILVISSLQGIYTSGVASIITSQQIVRNSTPIVVFDLSTTYVSLAGNGGGADTFIYLDSPASTSLITYKVQIATNNGSGVAHWNNSNANSSLTLMEIAA
jgi:hypothetical protein